MAEHGDTTDSQLSGSDVVVESEPDELVTAQPEFARDDEVDAKTATRVRLRTAGLAIAVGVCVVAAVGSLTGWFGFRYYENRKAKAAHQELVEAARQGAVNLTTIDYTTVDADIRRILDSATGKFHDDFQKRSQPFVDVVKQAKSKSEGTVTAAGLETQNGNLGQVLVAVSVKTSNIGAPEQQPREPRSWRMRISVEKSDDGVKVSDVQFVP